jgi:hypothetical protein
MAENLFRSGSGRFQKSDPDPVKNLPDPQHCYLEFPAFSLKWPAVKCMIGAAASSSMAEPGIKGTVPQKSVRDYEQV